MLYYTNNTPRWESNLAKPSVIAALALSLAFAQPAMAQETAAEPDPLVAAIAENSFALERAEDGSLSGPGYDKLMEEGEEAHFFLIGETHATADIAQIAGELHRGLSTKGYGHFVAEIGPWSTMKVEALIRSGEGNLAEFITTPGNQFTLPFLFFTEEIQFVEQVVALSPDDQDVLWGVDQEFLGAGPIIVPVLQDAVSTPAQEAAVATFAAGVGGNPMYLGIAPDEAIQALEEAFEGAPGPEEQIADAIALTHRVYGPFMRGTGPIYPANLERENYMKDNFLFHFNAAEARLGYPPKALFKFGGFHLERGLSGTNVPSLGNFMMEWGRSRGLSSVHVMMDCLGGEAYDIMAGGPKPCTPYSLDEGSPFYEALEGIDLTVIDLRALRPLLRRGTDVDAKTRDLILSYDFYIPIRDVKSATPAADLTLPQM